jgi:hypothetical protein
MYALVASVLCLKDTHFATVQKVIDDFILSLNYGEKYTPQQSEHMRPDFWKIDLNGKEMSVITELKEMGGSYRNVFAILNAVYRLPKGLPSGAIERSNCKIYKQNFNIKPPTIGLYGYKQDSMPAIN